MTPDPAKYRQVHIIDDDEAVRTSLCALLSAHKYNAIPSATAEEFLNIFVPELALCAIVDLRMPGMNGIELQKLLAARGIKTPMIILTAHGDVPMAVEAMKAGAVDFIEKPASESDILDAISTAGNHVAGRQKPALAGGVFSERLARLTGREKEVLEHLVLGMTNKNIAEELGISQRTVEIHRSRIREKMEARGLSDLIRMMK